MKKTILLLSLSCLCGTGVQAVSHYGMVGRMGSPLWPMTALQAVTAGSATGVSASLESADTDVAFTQKGFRAVLNNVVTEVTFYSPSIARVFKYNKDDGAALSDPKLAVTLQPGDVSVTCTQTTEGVRVSTGEMSVSYDQATGRVAFYDANGQEMLTEKEGATVMNPTKDGASDSYILKQTFTLDADEAIYGLGQLQNGMLNQRGQTFWGMVQGNTSVWIPYVHSVKGYGLYWDNMSPTTFIDDASGMSFESAVGHAVDYYYLAGSASQGDQTVARMRELTGQAPMIPLWAYGYFQSKERYQSADETMGVVKKYRDLRVPLDCIVQDWQYWGGNNQWNAMEFLNPQFSNYQEMIDSIHDMNAKIIISFWANFGPDTKQYAHLKDINALIKSGEDIMTDTYPTNEGVAIYDTYNADARDYYWDCVFSGLTSKGIDAYWMDSSEPDHYQGGEDREKTFDFVTGMGHTWRSVRNAYPLVHVENVYDHHRAESRCNQKRATILTRSAYAGMQRTGSNTWSGDITASWETLAKQIPAALNFTMCGIPNWNSDIGGFFNGDYTGAGQEEYNELYARWIQFGTFCTMMRSHGAGADRAIYRFGNRGSVWFDNIEKYIKLRYALLPYIYGTAWDAHKNGGSFMRAMPLAFPEDKNTYNMADEFMFGSSILVAPVLKAGAESREVYLPAGEKWVDFWTGEASDGGKSVSKPVDVQTMPLYVKAGSILPYGPKVQYSTQKTWDSLEVRIYPGADGQFILYEDEFDNYNYEQGRYTEIPFSWNEERQELTIGERTGSYDGMIAKRKFALVLVDAQTGTGSVQSQRVSRIVEYDGSALTVKVDNDNTIEIEEDEEDDLPVADNDFFPMDKLNPSIFAEGTFDLETQTLITGQYGFGGWEYVVPADWTPYKYLILELEAPQTCGASFRIYDEESFWTEPSYTDLGSETMYMIDLASLTKKGADGNPVPLNLSSIFRAGLWSYGGSPIVIKNIYLLKEGGTPVLPVKSHVGNVSGDIYDMSGMKVGNRVEDLRPGLYIMGGRKVMVK